MKALKLNGRIVAFTPQKEGGFTVEVPGLPGCITEGETLKEAEGNIKEATELYLETLKERKHKPTKVT